MLTTAFKFKYRNQKKGGGDWGDNPFSVEIGNIVPAIYSSNIYQKNIYSIVWI